MATVFQDTFTEPTTDTLITSHTPDTGTSWTQVWSGDANAILTVLTATDVADATNTVANQGVIYSADATYSNADYYAECEIVAGFTGTNRGYLIVRMQDQENMYALRFTTGGTTTRCYRKVSGGWTAIGSFVTDPAVGDTIRLEIIGTTLKFYYNGVEKGSSTQSDISAAGKAGFGMGGGAELAASTDDIATANQIDDFLVVDTTSVGGVTPLRMLMGIGS